MSTPFDEDAVDFLDVLMPIFKISSSDITNIQFIRYIAQKQKLIFLSTGASTIGEIKEAVSTALGHYYPTNYPITPQPTTVNSTTCHHRML